MRNRLIEGVEKSHIREKPFEFEIGDTVSVGVRITEGNKTRVQPFVGTVIARRGAGTNETFTVRRVVNNEGVERVFLVHSPNLVAIDVLRHGKTRRSKLYFLRDRVGKAQKLRERRAKSTGRGKSGGKGGKGGDDSGGSRAESAPAPAGDGDVTTPNREDKEVVAGV